jgi:hypothetical protein
MSDTFDPAWLPIMHGSVPHETPEDAWNLTLGYFPEIPAWPQLVQRSFLESIYVQFSERFPGFALDNERVRVIRDNRTEVALDRLYLAYLQGNLEYGAISPDHASGLAMLLEDRLTFMQPLEAIKGQITGPISFGLDVVDERRRPILYDDVMAEAMAHHLYLKAAWQEQELSRFSPNTIIFVNEPNMGSFGSAVAAISREEVISLLDEVLSGISGLSGIQSDTDTDWSLLLSTSADIVGVNAYDHADSLATSAEEVQFFLDRGGILAWGIVPATEDAATETVESLIARLDEAMDRLVQEGVSKDALHKTGLIAPTTGAGSLTPELTERVFYLTAGVSAAIRRRQSEG